MDLTGFAGKAALLYWIKLDRTGNMENVSCCLKMIFAVTDGTVQYEGPGVELAFAHLDDSDPLVLLQLQHRYTAVCLALKYTLGYKTNLCCTT